MAKKKQSKGASEKLAQAQAKNKYMQRLKQICLHFHPDLFDSLTKEDKETLYRFRSMGPCVTCNDQVSSEMLRYSEKFIRHHMTHYSIEVIPDRLTVNALEYALYIFPLDFSFMQDGQSVPGGEWFGISHFLKRSQAYAEIMRLISFSLTAHISNQRILVCTVKFNIFDTMLQNRAPSLSRMFLLSIYKPKKIKVLLDEQKNEYRTALELLQATDIVDNSLAENDPRNAEVYGKFEVLEPLMMSPSELGVKSGDDAPLPVLIMPHALERFEERLGCILHGFVEFQIVKAMKKGKVCYTPDGRILVEYYLFDSKAGYMLVDVLNDAILIRTFLFLTNGSTPEGERLRACTGMQKADVNYFNIDKLAPLVASDLWQDEELRRLFGEAGCQSLLDLCEAMQTSGFWLQTKEQKEIAAKFKKYMQLEAETLLAE